MNGNQKLALQDLCKRFHVEFVEDQYRPVFDLPSDWVAGWVGEIYVGCDPSGSISS
jgi:hypothetical protein